MFKTLAATALCAVVLVPAAFASGGVTLNDETEKAVRATLTEEGYEVAKVKTEDGLFEAYARKDGKKMEVFLDADYVIVRTKAD